MKRLLLLIILLCCLFIPNVADARFGDDYKAKYPGRVKQTASQLPSGKIQNTTVYTLFKRTLANGSPIRLVVRDSGGLVKICSISYGNRSDVPRNYVCFSWGDGETRHELKRFISYSERIGWNRYDNFITSHVQAADLEEMKAAVIFSVEGGGTLSTPLLTPSHKRWKEWQEAVEAAAILMRER